MESLLVVLTGLSFWLLVFRAGRNQRARTLEAAGPLLLEIKASRRTIRWRRSVNLFIYVVFFLMMAEGAYLVSVAERFLR